MNNLNFGVPNLREKKEEKYTDVGVLTFHPTGEGLGRKMELNSKALELLKADDKNNQISFSFNGQEIYIVNTSGIENTSGLKIGKTTNGFSDKKHYNFIKEKMFGIADSETLELFFKETEQEFNENKVFKLVRQIELVDDVLDQQDPEESLNEDLDDNGILKEETYTDSEEDQLNSQEYAKRIEQEEYSLEGNSYNNYPNNGGTEV